MVRSAHASVTEEDSTRACVRDMVAALTYVHKSQRHYCVSQRHSLLHLALELVGGGLDRHARAVKPEGEQGVLALEALVLHDELALQGQVWRQRVGWVRMYTRGGGGEGGGSVQYDGKRQKCRVVAAPQTYMRSLVFAEALLRGFPAFIVISFSHLATKHHIESQTVYARVFEGKTRLQGICMLL